ncbi:MAG: hypothetical protein V3V08_06680 [Nannocystaceae bacterium]
MNVNVKIQRKLKFIGAVLPASLLYSAVAHAAGDGKPGVLDGKPIVVSKLQLRKLRLQVTPRATLTLSQPFTHVAFAGAKLRFDITDWLGVRGDFDYRAVDTETKLTDDLLGGALPVGRQITGGANGLERPLAESDNPAPLQHDFKAGVTRLNWTSSVGLAFTPFAGKLGLFQALFTEYDLYLWGGYGFTNWVEAYPDAVSTQTSNADACNASSSNGKTLTECALHPVSPETGLKSGPAFGAGFHLFLTDWLALNPEVQDTIIRHNISGLNATIRDVPPVIDRSDRVIVHNANFSLGFTIYLPPKAKRSKITP